MKRQVEPVYPIYTVDAFAEAPHRGNPAGVCFLMGHQDEAWMQMIAAEMNLSETAFFQQKGKRFSLRWFTPTTEVDLCGHATLATAHVIWESQIVGPDETIAFDTRSGLLTARRQSDWIELDFPAVRAQQAPLPAGLVEALGLDKAPKNCRKNKFDYLLELDSAEAVKALRPDFHSLAQVECRGTIVTAPSDMPGQDYISRFFAPAVGVDEDPVTGSAHCCLGPYWTERLGRSSLTGFQASDRGGLVQTELRGDRVLLRGKAITMVQGVYTGQA